ncbi:MAG: 4-(cytidine 5'-diphospho)-2-C-methyl-D-erythritol kinase [Fuerstiella sp.]
MTLNSYAKLNVFLEVLKKREDGFHELETIMLRTQFCDKMHFRARADQLTLQISELSRPASLANFPLDESNLILKAAEALRAHAHTNLGAEITIQKRIPAEAGLAGGSSNAATTLLALNELWQLKLPTEELHSIAATLGSDINFFVEDCRAAVCRGRGELVEPVAVSGSFYFVALRPATGNSTPAVFSQLTLPTVLASSCDVLKALETGDVRQLDETAFNRLTVPASEVNSEMKCLMSDIAAMTGRRVHMSGSGSTCFLIAKSERDAEVLVTLVGSSGYEVIGLLRV